MAEEHSPSTSPLGLTPALRRERAVLSAAASTTGPAELVDFLVPLWAGTVLDLSATAVGLLVAVELALALLFRPVVGVLADHAERRNLGAAGALLYAVSFAGYALGSSLDAAGAAAAFAAAATGGIGGAFLAVALRAMIGERQLVDPTVYPRLFAAQETGTWVAMVAGLVLLGSVGWTGVFLLCATACGWGAAELLKAPRVRDSVSTVPKLELLAVGRRLRPLLLVVVAVSTAEAVVGLLLLLHLQRGFNLDVIQIAVVFLPGAVAGAVLAEPGHRLVMRVGRRRGLMVSLLSSAAFAASLAAAPSPLVVAVLWALSAGAFAVTLPLQQAVVAEAVGARMLGRGLGVYEGVAFGGGVLGAVVAGGLYDSGGWQMACLVSAGVLVLAAALGPVALRTAGAMDRPVVTGPGVAPTPLAGVVPLPPPSPAAVASVRPARWATPEPLPSARTAADVRRLGRHAAAVLVAQLALVLLDASWARDIVAGAPWHAAARGATAPDGLLGLLHSIGRLWLALLALDVMWTLGKLARLHVTRVSRSRRDLGPGREVP